MTDHPICAEEQKLLDEYAACFSEPTDAERLADKLLRELEAELDAMSWAQNAARDKDLARRVQDYLKERE